MNRLIRMTLFITLILLSWQIAPADAGTADRPTSIWNWRIYARILATLDDEAFQRIHAVLEPGFGFSERDEAVLWINEETGLLGLVHFTIEGLASTRGAHVDVAFSNYQEIDGYIWPTEFYERVRAPLRVPAHSWRVVALQVSPDSVDDYLAKADPGD
mgnify:CR=1 FL=1